MAAAGKGTAALPLMPSISCGILRAMQVVSATALLFWAGFLFGWGGQPLPAVTPHSDLGPDGLFPAGIAEHQSWTRILGPTVVGMALTVTPGPRRSMGGAGQIAGGLWLATLTGFWSILSVDAATGGFGPDARQCIYASCWPAWPQQFALMTPGLLAAAAMVVMSTAFRHRWWVWRMTVPVGVLLLATLVQVAVWGNWLQPLFQGPPPAWAAR